MCLYIHLHIPTGDYELIFFIGHRILFNAVKYANSLISFVVVWWEIVTFQVDFFFFFIWIKIWNSDHTQHPLVPVTGVVWPFISFLPSACVWGALHLVALLAGWRQVSVSVRGRGCLMKGTVAHHPTSVEWLLSWIWGQHILLPQLSHGWASPPEMVTSEKEHGWLLREPGSADKP